MNTIDEAIAVLQEFKKNGNKNIEFSGNGRDWYPRKYTGSGFNFGSVMYRIKRQPQEVSLYRNKSTGEVGTAQYFFQHPENYELVTFREVIEEK